MGELKVQNERLEQEAENIAQDLLNQRVCPFSPLHRVILIDVAFLTRLDANAGDYRPP